VATVLTAPETTDMVYVSIPIEKWEQDSDGDLIVKGVATDGTVDSDSQIVDPDWSAKALNDWIATGGNVRQSHDAHRPIGKGLQVEINRENSGKHWVTSVVVDRDAQRMIKKGVLTAYSVGIARPVIKHDPSGRARGGIIIGGELAELSIVDRPSNKSSYLEIAKSAADGSCEFTGKMFGADLFKADPDHDGDDDSTAAGDTDHDYWSRDGKQLKPLPKAEDMSLTFTPNDLAKILKSKIIEQHYEELAAEAAAAEKRDFDRGVGGGVDRDKLPASDFAGPHRSFPVVNQSDVSDAMGLAGHADNPDQVRARIRSIADKKDLSAPDSDSDKGSEKGDSVTDPVTTDELNDAVKEAEPVITKDPEDQEETQETPAEVSKAKAKPKKGKKMPPWLNSGDSMGGPDGNSKSGADQDQGDSKKSGDPDLCTVDHVHSEKCSGTPKSVAGVTDAADMSPIPNQGPAQESPMPAGRADPDISPGAGSYNKGTSTSPEVAALLRFKSLGMDADLGRLHDFTCPAFDLDDIAKYHPFADFSTIIDEGIWQRKALDAACGPTQKAMEITQVWGAAQLLKSADPAVLNDFRLEAHKAFRDANPGPTTYPTPGCVCPSTFNRPVITAGHATNSPGYDGPNTAPDVASSPARVGSFTRPPLSSMQETPSPSFMKATFEYPQETGVPVRIQYAEIEKDKARRALSTMHDHLSHMFPSACPMLDKDPHVQPESRPVPLPVGIGKTVDQETQETSVSKMPDEWLSDEEFMAFKGMRKKLGKKVLAGKMTVDEARSRLGRRFTQKTEDIAPAEKSEVPEITKTIHDIGMVTPEITPEVMENLLTKALTPFLEKIQAQDELLAKQQTMLDAIADQPDPSTASFSGFALNPMMVKNTRPAVVKQAEVAERTQQMIRRQLEKEYLTTSNPFTREAVWEELQKYSTE
jgi:hypothetical protein